MPKMFPYTQKLMGHPLKCPCIVVAPCDYTVMTHDSWEISCFPKHPGFPGFDSDLDDMGVHFDDLWIIPDAFGWWKIIVYQLNCINKKNYKTNLNCGSISGLDHHQVFQWTNPPIWNMCNNLVQYGGSSVSKGVNLDHFHIDVSENRGSPPNHPF